MNDQSSFYSIKPNIRESKAFVYKEKKYPIDFDLIKSNSDYFYLNQRLFQNSNEIVLQFPICLSDSSIENFILCCQNRAFQITDSNIFHLHYLSHIYGVKALTEITTKYISDHHESLLLKSLLFKQQLNNLTEEKEFFLEISGEEDFLASHFLEYANNDQFLSLPLSCLYRIFTKFLIEFNSDDNETNGSQIAIFLFKCLDKYKREASPMFSNIDIMKHFEIIQRLCTEYSNVFDFSMINSKSALEQIIKESKEKEKLKEENTKVENDFSNFKKKVLPFVPINKLSQLIEFSIPLNENWKIESPTKCILNTNNGKIITVTSSSTFKDMSNHHPSNLFNGKLEIDGDRWDSNIPVTDPFIQIQFNYHVAVNAVYIASRNRNYIEAPRKFGLFAYDNEIGKFVSLFEGDGIIWSKDERKFFPFKNNKSFNLYKVVFYLNNSIVSIAELNLCNI